jgi:hypothetical protein
MAALSDRDLRAILGDDYLAKLNAAEAATGLTDEIREARKERQNLEEKKFAGMSAVAVGAALLAAGLLTREPSFWIQATAAVVIAGTGAAWLAYIWRLQGQLLKG